MIRNDVAKSLFCSKLDMSDVYEQTHVEPSDVLKTVFSTVAGTFANHIMHIGDCNMPATFNK